MCIVGQPHLIEIVQMPLNVSRTDPQVTLDSERFVRNTLDRLYNSDQDERHVYGMFLMTAQCKWFMRLDHGQTVGCLNNVMRVLSVQMQSRIRMYGQYLTSM